MKKDWFKIITPQGKQNKALIKYIIKKDICVFSSTLLFPFKAFSCNFINNNRYTKLSELKNECTMFPVCDKSTLLPNLNFDVSTGCLKCLLVC